MDARLRQSTIAATRSHCSSTRDWTLAVTVLNACTVTLVILNKLNLEGQKATGDCRCCERNTAISLQHAATGTSTAFRVSAYSKRLQL
jgi:hypothetical protein